MDPPATPSAANGHKRSKSAILRSVVTPGTKSTSPTKQLVTKVLPKTDQKSSSIVTPDSRANAPVLGEIQGRTRAASLSPRKNNRRLANGGLKGKEDNFKDKAELESRLQQMMRDNQPTISPQVKDKENTTPPRSANNEAYTPIWAQFSSQNLHKDTPSNANGFQHQVQQNIPSQELPPQPLLSRQQPQNGYLSGSPQRAPMSPSPLNARPQATPRGGTRGSEAPRGRPTTWYHANVTSETKPLPVAGAQMPQPGPKRDSNVLETAAILEGKAASDSVVGGKDLDEAFEAVLVARNIPENMRRNMRTLDAKIKADFIKHDRVEIPKTPQEEPTKSSFWGLARPKTPTLGRGRSASRNKDDAPASTEQQDSPKKRGRSRSRTFTLTKRDQSSSKRQRSNSRPRSLMSLKNLSSTSVNSLGMDGAKESKEPTSAKAPDTPDQFVIYLRQGQDPKSVEVGKLHKLRLLLRNESLTWVESFISEQGMTELLALLKRVIGIEWRDDHDDMLLHETLLCLKGLCTTSLALEKLSDVESTLFPDLTKLVFDEERKGPSEFNTRGIIFHIMLAYLFAAPPSQQESRASSILGYLSNPETPTEEQPLGFVQEMRRARPYTSWCKEVHNVSREVFWIFLHHLNVVPLETPTAELQHEPYRTRHFPKDRPPVPAAPYIGGVEWEATNYLATHLDLLNGLIASFASVEARNALREELKVSGFEKVMGGSLRLCKEKFYSMVHDGLRTWVAAAAEDGWETHDVRQGPPRDQASPSKSPRKKAEGAVPPPPKLELPKFD